MSTMPPSPDREKHGDMRAAPTETPESDSDQTEILDPMVHGSPQNESGVSDEPDLTLVSNPSSAEGRDAWLSSLSEDVRPEHTLAAPSSEAEPGETTVAPAVVLNRRDVVERDDSSPCSQNSVDYELEKQLGEGGRGVVHAARQTSMDRPVAIKVLKSRAARLESSRQAFVSEAIITGGLDHPNIVPIYDVGKQSDDALFYAMKQVEGVEWKDRLPQLSLDENLDILLRVCDAVAFGHARFIIHRDLKPANVMLGSFGEVLVMDWGLAMPSPNHPQREMFPRAQRGGTPHYMAPELVGDPMTDVDHRCDVYLLGAILFEIITGKAPHVLESPPTNRREHVNACLQAVSENWITPAEVSSESSDLMQIARTALSTNPEDRYQQVTDFQAALREHLSHVESIELTERAAVHLKTAEQSGGYDEFSRARFGFEAALEEWPQNLRAGTCLKDATAAYARTALERGDLDLALSLLDSSEQEHERLLARVNQALKERALRVGRIRRLRRLSLLASLLTAIIASGASVWINSARNKALNARAAESRQRGLAEKARLTAERNADEALRQKTIAENERQLARSSEQKALVAESVARRESDKAQKLLVIADRNAYRSDMLLVQSGWATGQIRNVKTLLGRYRDRKEIIDFEWHYWDRYRGNLITSSKQFEKRPSMLFAPDGLRLVLGIGATSTPAIRDLRSSQAGFRLRGHTGVVTCVACSQDGVWLASASADKTVKVRDAATGETVLTLKGHTGAVSHVTFSRDRSVLASASHDRTVKLWLAGSETPRFTLTGHTGRVIQTCFSPDGNRIASASWDHTIRIWNVETGELQNTLTGHADRMAGVTFSPDGMRLASASWDNTVKIWDAETGQELDTLRGHQGRTTSVAFSPDGQLLASGSYDSSVKVWHSASGRELFTLRGHTRRGFQVSFSPDGMRLLSTNGDRTVKVWNPDTLQEPITIRGRLGEGQVAISPDGQSLAFTGTEGVRVWDTNSGLRSHLLTRRTPTGDQQTNWHVASVSFSPNGKQLAATDRNHVTLWEMPAGEQVARLSSDKGNITRVCFSPDGRHLAAGHAGHAVEIWDLDTAQSRVVLTGHSGAVNCMDYTPDGKFLATGSNDWTINIWDVERGRLEQTLTGHTGKVTGVSFSPDGMRLASASYDSTVAVWDPRTGVQHYVFEGHTDRLTSVRFSPNGKRLASAGWDNTVKVVDSLTGQVMLTLRGHTSGVTDVVFDPGGLRLFTAGDDRTVRIWDARPWTEALEVEIQALRLLKAKQGSAQSREQLHAVIRAVKCIGLHPEVNTTFRNKVISRAVEMADQYWRNITQE